MEEPVYRRLEGEARFGRFASLLFGSSCARPLYDEVLCAIDGCVVAPTLGSILPNWLLVVPRIPSVNFLQWRAETGIEPHQLMSKVLVELGIDRNQALWFEHGPVDGNSPVSCGADHAHLHLIVDAPFVFDDFVSAATRATDLSWSESPIADMYRNVRPETSYLVAASTDRAVLAVDVDCVGSQFFRRVVAELIEQPHTWDYKAYPYIDNIRKTLTNFRDQSRIACHR
ncbi:MAG: hypothetical protein HYR63_26630 [Proteobacteria bacterium]|nr:hypothetical protein [Pseudomonadota bacterium]MBI3495969.1 hypothetical protein [Pseudomonadota bacterium]